MTDSFKAAGWWGGIAVAVTISILAGYAADWVGTSLLGFDKSPISAIMMAIILGMIIANMIALPAGLQSGLRFCTNAILKAGIMLLGIRLSLLSAGQFTLVALPFIIAAIAAGLLTVGLIGRTMGLSKQLSGLIAVGTAICGCTAIVATAPLIKANESEITYSIACITLFGLAAMFFYPLLAHYAFADQPELAGLFLGTSIHETAQVAGAGLMYEAQYNSPVALELATVTKLVRNLCMIAVIPLVGILYGSERTAGDDGKVNYLAMIPWFIVGFAAMSAIRTIGDQTISDQGELAFGILEPAQWSQVVLVTRDIAERCLLIAMAAVGLTSLFSGMRNIGLRPFALGLFAALLVGGVSFALISAFAPRLINMIG